MRNGLQRSNRTTRRLSSWSGAVILSLAAVGGASTAEREQGAHVHGIGQIDVAVEGGTVDMRLGLPGADIVGFEHAAESAEDKAAVDKAVATLKAGGALFAFPAAAQCRLRMADVESALVEEGHEGTDEHGHGEAESGHKDDKHAEFHAHYQFQCDHPAHLTHVDVKIFERFPAARELTAQKITSRGQSAQQLTPTSTRLTF